MQPHAAPKTTWVPDFIRTFFLLLSWMSLLLLLLMLLLTHFASKCGSRQNYVHFRDIWPHSSPEKVARACSIFFEMRFSPHGLQFFHSATSDRHPNVLYLSDVRSKYVSRRKPQRWLRPEVFLKALSATSVCTFSVSQVRPSLACTLSTSQLPNVVREWCVLRMFPSKYASRDSGVLFFQIQTSKKLM